MYGRLFLWKVTAWIIDIVLLLMIMISPNRWQWSFVERLLFLLNQRRSQIIWALTQTANLVAVPAKALPPVVAVAADAEMIATPTPPRRDAAVAVAAAIILKIVSVSCLSSEVLSWYTRCYLFHKKYYFMSNSLYWHRPLYLLSKRPYYFAIWFSFSFSGSQARRRKSWGMIVLQNKRCT